MKAVVPYSNIISFMQFAIICKRIDNSSFQLHKECFGNFNGWIYSIKTNPKRMFRLITNYLKRSITIYQF